MKVCYTLICILFLTALQDGDAGGTYRGMEGTNITVGCKFNNVGISRFFCKENCKGENNMIDTIENRHQRGRYSIQYEGTGYFSSVLSVSITYLKPSDSGQYWCGLGDVWIHGLYDGFNLIVTEERMSSSSPSSPTETTKQSRASGLLLYVLLSLVAKIILFSTPLVIFCRKRRLTESKGPAVETEFSEISQTNP
ncbi:uncharacterized protein LOC119773986 isoform X3 [Cyprinodon tularosa]|uniref:uncharacterized protein LOC119773986 isoform X3 n=1 Tax=Cyprinodon tularosa TaxID=77115 RepID=UPI0018E240C0|nr:uncharacterized protein LOC119773986 isoform X3 [Cyprinodon tularosa]